MSCLEVLVKILLVVVNVVVLICGVGLIVFGSILISFSESFPNSYEVYSILMVAFGCFLLVTACCGCCGAIANNVTALSGYILFAVVIIAINIYVIVVVSDARNDVEAKVGEELESIFASNETREQFHFLEYWFNCCGTTGASSYEAIGVALPPTCCPNSLDITSIDDIIEAINQGNGNFCSSVTYTGCTAYLATFIDDLYLIAFFCVLIFIFGKVFDSLIAVYLVLRIRKKNKKNAGRVVNMTQDQNKQTQSRSSPYYYGKDRYNQ